MTFNHTTQLILVAVVSILGTVAALHTNGYVRHSSEEDALYVSEFSLLANTPGLSQTVSAKPAEFVARCADGYLVMDSSKASKAANGLLVDQKKRPVTCISQ